MPILFKTSCKQSSVHGLGFFAEEDIPKGAIWWVFDNNVQGVPCLNAPNLPNLIITQQKVEEFVKDKKPEELEAIVEHTMNYQDGDALLILRDGGGVVNHSFTPNSQIQYNSEGDATKLKSYTLRQIKAAEELTQNYSNYCKLTNDWKQNFFRRYTPSRLQFEKEQSIEQIQ